jgi:hypothetical protein
MTNTPINFKKQRDFGDLFNATFGFISQEFKKLATAILYFVVPFLLLSAIASTLYSVKAQEVTQTLAQGGKPGLFAIFAVWGSLMGYVGALMVLSICATTMLISTVYCYIKLYTQKGTDGFSINDVWIEVTKYFWSVLVASILVGIVIGIGIVFCVLPGIYFGVALSIIFCIMIFEEKGFYDSFSRSMKLIKTDWWGTFGVLVVAAIIVYIIAFLFSIPSLMLGFSSLFESMKTGQAPVVDFSVGFYIVNSLTQLLTQFLSVIPIVITAFIYFSTVEKVEQPSLMDKIGQIGDNE